MSDSPSWAGSKCPEVSGAEFAVVFGELCSKTEKEKCSQGTITLNACMLSLCSLFMAVSAYL